MARVLNPNLAKLHRNYTVEEIASLYGVHKNAVRTWIKSGLTVCDARRPILILGRDLREFLQLRRDARKQRCGPQELYCMSCRSPRQPAEGMVEFLPMTQTTGRLIALCPVCTTMMNRYVRIQSPDVMRACVDARVSAAHQHICETR